MEVEPFDTKQRLKETWESSIDAAQKNISKCEANLMCFWGFGEGKKKECSLFSFYLSLVYYNTEIDGGEWKLPAETDSPESIW